MRAGIGGEKIAAAYLEDSGYEILRKNYRSRRGEIDIVALKDETLVFVEVKTWGELPFSELARSLDRKKRDKIIRESRRFMYQELPEGRFYIRYDVVYIDPQRAHIEHIIDAFTETDAA
jgi:putative endonuclease